MNQGDRYQVLISKLPAEVGSHQRMLEACRERSPQLLALRGLRFFRFFKTR
jgi:hypothetical protein